MSGSAALGGGKSDSSQQSTSAVSTPEQLEAYFNSMNQMSGGQLGSWAQNGTQQTQYNALTQGQLEAIGGAGATRKSEIDMALADQQEQLNQNSSLTYAQTQQGGQQAYETAMTQKDAVNKEVEAAMTGLASQEAMNTYQADLANAGLTANDMALLSQIYFGGKGQYSQSTGDSSSWNMNTSGSFGLW